jgi:hypothetical protein
MCYHKKPLRNISTPFPYHLFQTKVCTIHEFIYYYYNLLMKWTVGQQHTFQAKDTSHHPELKKIVDKGRHQHNTNKLYTMLPLANKLHSNILLIMSTLSSWKKYTNFFCFVNTVTKLNHVGIQS